MPEKVEAIQALSPPKSKREVCRFIGLINYYQDMWFHRSANLAPLTALTSANVKWQWKAEHQLAFETVKRSLSKSVLLTYPDFTQQFDIYTDASDVQLGSVITQNKKPIAFYSRKLNPAQTRYTTGEQELLSLVETFKAFRNILLGHKIVAYTDHFNLTYKNFTAERVFCWRFLS